MDIIYEINEKYIMDIIYETNEKYILNNCDDKEKIHKKMSEICKMGSFANIEYAKIIMKNKLLDEKYYDDFLLISFINSNHKMCNLIREFYPNICLYKN